MSDFGLYIKLIRAMSFVRAVASASGRRKIAALFAIKSIRTL